MVRAFIFIAIEKEIMSMRYPISNMALWSFEVLAVFSRWDKISQVE